jgi:hypothetical protein
MSAPIDNLDISVLQTKVDNVVKGKKGVKERNISKNEVEDIIVAKNAVDPYLEHQDKIDLSPQKMTMVFNESTSSETGSDIGSISDVIIPDVRRVSTERQDKVLGFLKNIVGLQDASNKFLVVLSKLGIEDYKGLGLAIIQCEDIPLLARQNYLGVISKYKELLQKKMIEGKPTHNGIDINLIINSLNF